MKILIGIIVISLLFIILKVGINKQEQRECQIWKAQSEQYPNFYYTDWQKEQCKI